MSVNDKLQIEAALRENEALSHPGERTTCKKCSEQYCSTQCKEKDFLEYHQSLCSNKPEIQQLYKMIKEEGSGGEQSLFLFRIFAKLEQERKGRTSHSIWNHLKRLCYSIPGISKSASLGSVEEEHFQLLKKIFPKLVGLDSYVRFRSVINLNSMTIGTNGFGLLGRIEGGELLVDHTFLNYDTVAALFPIGTSFFAFFSLS